MEGFVPKVPRPATVLQEPKGTKQLKEALGMEKLKTMEEESLIGWIASSFRAAKQSLPSMAKMIGIQLAIVLAINLIFWQINTWRLPGALSKIVMAIVFLTATYNNVIPKTIFWVIIFTFGRRLFRKVMREGFGKAIQPITRIIPEFNEKRDELKTRAYSILLIGGGIGLIIANNFASYSRFSGARNKMDKYFVAIVISFAVSYILGEGNKSGIVKFMMLLIQDVSKVLGRNKPKQLEAKTVVLLSGFVMGLLLDAPLILMGLMYGGYILGAIALIAGIALKFIVLPVSKV